LLGWQLSSVSILICCSAFEPCLKPGDVVTTLSRGNENRIGRIDERGIEVTTEHSMESAGGAPLVPVWMFNVVRHDY